MIWFHLIVEIARKGNTSCSVKVGMLVMDYFSPLN